MAAKSNDEKKSHMVTIRMDRPMKTSMDEAAEATGRSLSGEIQHRLADYESMRRLVDDLLDDSAAIKVATVLKSLRERAGSLTAPITTGEELVSLQRAVITATCISKLFEIVADHARETLTNNAKKWLPGAWQKRIDAGEIAGDFDIDATAAEISAGLSSLAKQGGKGLAGMTADTAGPSIWDICFDKDDPLRSAPRGKGYGLMGTLVGSNVGLPPAFLPPISPETELLVLMATLKDGGAFRDAVKRQMSEGLHPGMSEDEVVDMLYDELVNPFGMDPDEAVSNVATG